MITYREAKKSEIRKISDMVATSFGEYPMYTLTFRDKFKTKDDFIRYTKKLNRVHIGANARKHKCFVCEIDGKIVSVALLQNPNIKRISLFDYILAGGVGLLFPVGFKRLIGFFDISNEAHRDCAKRCGDAWYVELLAVSPDCKGQGLGSKMLNDCMVPYVESRKGTELALITNTPSNCKFYEKNGFINFAVSELKWNSNSIQNWSFTKTFGK